MGDGTTVGVAVGRGVGVEVEVGDGVLVGVAVGVGVNVGVGVFVGTGVDVGVRVGVEVGVSVGIGEGEDVAVGSGGAVAVGCGPGSVSCGAAKDTGGGCESGGLSGALSANQHPTAPTSNSAAAPNRKTAPTYEASLVVPVFVLGPFSKLPRPVTQVSAGIKRPMHLRGYQSQGCRSYP